MLVWDFARQIDAAASPGNTTSYFDEMCQSTYIDTGQIKTQIGQVLQGQWQNVANGAEIAISDVGYSALDLEHHYNGAVFGSAQHSTDVVFLMYEYMLDVSAWLQAGTWQMQPDSAIKAGSITLKNGDIRRFSDDAYTLFSPGSRLRSRFRAGDSEPYDIGTYHIEDSPFRDDGDAFTFSGSNPIGFHLAKQTFDDRTAYTGERATVVRQMLIDAGVPTYMIIVQADTTAVSYTFNDSDTYLSGLQKVGQLSDWYLDDLPDGRIIMGGLDFIRGYITTGIYTFHRGADVISRSVNRSLSGSYSRVCVKRAGTTPLSLFAEVPYYDGWYLASHRTYYQTVPDDTTNADMARIRDDLVAGMQYSGITEQFVGPFRPWLQSGDVGVVTGGTTDRVAGIITDIIHQFGESGFFTQFTITSGGTISNPDNPATVASQYTGKMGGANRQRRLLDYINKS